MDDLIQTVASKAGISAEQAKTAVESVTAFLKEKIPALGGQIDGLLKGGGGAGGALGGLGDKIGGLFGS